MKIYDTLLKHNALSVSQWHLDIQSNVIIPSSFSFSGFSITAMNSKSLSQWHLDIQSKVIIPSSFSFSGFSITAMNSKSLSPFDKDRFTWLKVVNVSLDPSLHHRSM